MLSIITRRALRRVSPVSGVACSRLYTIYGPDVVHTSPFAAVESPANSMNYGRAQIDLLCRPANTGVISDGFETETIRRFTHQEIGEMCKRVGAGLAARGLSKGSVLAVNMLNTAEYIPACLGPIALGSTVTLLPPQFLGAEVASQLADCSSKFIICDETTRAASVDGSLEAGISKDNIYYVGDETIAAEHGLRSFKELTDYKSTELPEVSIAAYEDTAILPYSSGTTGKPKGVELTHANLESNRRMIYRLNEGSMRNNLGLLPFYHIYGFSMAISHISSNDLNLAILNKFDPAVFLTTIMKEKVTLAHIVPPIAVFLAKHPVVEKFDLSSLEMIFSGAAPLGKDTQKQLMTRIGCHVTQGYGMTELSPLSHSFMVSDRDDPESTVGYCAPNTESMVVDIDTGIPIPKSKPNTRGELWVKGPQVMKGYFGRPEETANTMEGEWLKTGDIVEVDTKGRFCVIDRLKELIKYKGHQIAPAELEDVLLSSPDVADTAVIAGTDAHGEEIPLAFVVKSKGSEVSEECIVEYVAGRVAPFKKVRKVHFVDEIPKAASGKILRRHLRSQHSEKK